MKYPEGITEYLELKRPNKRYRVLKVRFYTCDSLETFNTEEEAKQFIKSHSEYDQEVLEIEEFEPFPKLFKSVK